ncbi:MAG: hypothetical protein Fur0037_01180 [Planctomycetota bacterium]
MSEMPRLPLGPPKGQWARMSLMGALLAGVLYAFFFVSPPAAVYDPTEFAAAPKLVVPELDAKLLASIDDSTHEKRLLEPPPEPLKHLLSVALNVSSRQVARALGLPEKPVSADEVRAAPEHMRGRWLSFKGKVEEMNGPRRGHPHERDGYSIYEARILTADGSRILFTFSIPPGAGVRRGGYAEASGFMMMLRDTTFPMALEKVPLLVGRELSIAYEDWPAVTELDPSLLAQVDDGEVVNGRYVPDSGAFLGLDEEQREPLWHMASYARYMQDRLDKAAWRARPAMSSKTAWDDVYLGRVPRGTKLRILGTVAKLPRTIEANPNPAGIRYWTEVWVQVRDLGGKLFPIWIPDRATANIQDGLEVRGYYFKRYAYETLRGGEARTAVFVASRLDYWQPDVDPMLQVVWVGIAVIVTLIVLWLWLSQRRERQRSEEVQNHLIERRRKRRMEAARTQTSP